MSSNASWKVQARFSPIGFEKPRKCRNLNGMSLKIMKIMLSLSALSLIITLE
jgi:hypothetical protein